MDALLNVVENVAGDCTKADDAEQYAIEELPHISTHYLAWLLNAVATGNDGLWCPPCVWASP